MIDYDAFRAERPPSTTDTASWRAYRDRMQPLMDGLNDFLRLDDEQELEQLRLRAAALESRLGVRPTPPPAPSQTPRPAKPHNPVSETDWGQGIGGREKPIDPVEFRNELADLRDRTTEKRARRGVP